MAHKDDTNSQLIITIGAVAGFLVIVLTIGLQAWFLNEEQSETELKWAEAVNHRLKDLRSTQAANLSTYRWIDKDKQIAAVPIDEAMKTLIQNQGKLPK